MKTVLRNNQLVLTLEHNKRFLSLILAVCLLTIGVVMGIYGSGFFIRGVGVSLFVILTLAVGLLSQDRKNITFDATTQECVLEKTLLGFKKRSVHVSFNDIEGFIIERRRNPSFEPGPSYLPTLILLLKNRGEKKMLLDIDTREKHIQKHISEISSFLGKEFPLAIEEKSIFSPMLFDY